MRPNPSTDQQLSHPRSWGRLAKVWSQVTEPPPAIQDENERRLSRLLASILIAVLPLMVAVGLIAMPIVQGVPALWMGATFPPASLAIITSIAAYVLNRSGQYRIAAVIYIFAFVFCPWWAVVRDASPTNLPIAILMVGGVMLAGVLSPETLVMLVYAIASSAGAALLPLVVPAVSFADVGAVLSVIITLNVMLIVVTHYRDDLEARRREGLQYTNINLHSAAQYSDERLNDLTQTIVRICTLDFSARAAIGTSGDVFDAIGTGLNALAEELMYATVSRDFLLNITNSMLDSMVITDCDGRIEMVNAATCRLLGYQESELLGQPISSLFVEQFRRADVHDLEERTVVTKDGRHIPVSCSTSQMRNDQGRPAGFICVAQDITERKQVQLALQTSQNRLQQAVQAGNIGIFDHDQIKDIIYWSPEQRAIYGWCPDEPVTLEKYFKQVHPDDQGWIMEAVQRAHDPTGDGRFDVEHRIIDRSGGIHWLSTRSRTFFDSEGDARRSVRTIGAVADITERKRQEETLRESEARLRIVMENLPIMVDALDENFRFVAWNKECERVTGYSAAEMIGNPKAVELLYPRQEQRDQMMSDFERLGNSFRNLEWSLTSKSGEEKIISWSNVSERFPVPGWQTWAVGVDVTERKQTEAALRASEERFRVLVANLSDIITVMNADGTIAFESHSVTRMLGYAAEEMIGKSAFDYIHPDDLPGIAALFAEKITQMGAEARFEFRFRHVDGSWVAMESHAANLLDDPVIHGVVITSRDVTERKRAAALLRLNEARLREAQTVAHVGNWDWNLVANELFWSDEVYRIFGLDPQEVKIDVTIFMESCHPEDAERIGLAINGALAGQGYAIEHRIVLPDGQVRHVQQNGMVSFDQSGTPVRFFGTTQDITERKQAEKNIWEQARLLDLIFRYTPDSLALLDQDFNFIRVSESYARAGQRDVSYFPGRNHFEVYPSDFQAEAEDVRQHKYVYSKMARPFVYADHPEWGTTYWDLGLVPILDQAGEIDLFLFTLRNVTERVQAEQAVRQLNEELEQRVIERTRELEQANEEIRHFAYIVSHDLRAPLVNLKGFSSELRSAVDVLKDGCDEVLPRIDPIRRDRMLQALQEDIPEALRFIESSVDNMDSFTKAILRLSRLGRSQLDLVRVDVRSLVQRTLDTLSHQIKQRGVTLSIGELPDVTADLVSMEQIFGNILSNAIAYLVPDRAGEIEITAEQRADETLFRIRDNGRGIAKEDMDKVFAPFRRAGKQDVPGEGMGLAYVQALVRRHDGRIWCESEPGIGTTFTFTLRKNLIN